jgi:hypothetical protein
MVTPSAPPTVSYLRMVAVLWVKDERVVTSPGSPWIDPGMPTGGEAKSAGARRDLTGRP